MACTVISSGLGIAKYGWEGDRLTTSQTDESGVPAGKFHPPVAGIRAGKNSTSHASGETAAGCGTGADAGTGDAAG